MSQPVDVVSVGIQYDTKTALQQLQRAVDDALGAVRREFEQSFDTIEREMSQVSSGLQRTFAESGEHAEASIREIGRQADYTFDKVSRDATKAGADITTKLGGALKWIAGIGVAATIGAGLVTITKAGLASAASLEQTQVAFNSLLGSAEKGKEVFDSLKQFAAATPFELTDLTGLAQRFLAFDDAVGIGDDQLTNFLTTIGNVVSVTGGGAQALNSVGLAMGQISSSGKLTLDNLNQISEALPGFSGVAAIAAARGTTTGQAMKDISSGAISAEEGVKDLLAGMEKFPGAAGAMEAQSKTLLGVFSTFKDTLSQSLAGAFDPVIPALKDTLTEITPIIGDALGLLAPSLGGILISVLSAVKPLIEPLAAILTNVLDVLNPFIQALGPVLLPIVQALEDPLAQLAGVLIELAPSILEILSAVLPLVPALGDLLSAFLMIATPLVKILAGMSAFFANKALAPVIQVLANSFEGLAGAFQIVGEWLSAIDWESVGEAIMGFFSMIGDAVAAVGDWFSKLPGRIGDALAKVPGLVAKHLQELGAFLYTLPGRIIGTIARIIVGLITAIANIDWGEVFTAIFTFLGQMSEAFLGFVNDIIKFLVVDLPVGIADGVVKALAALGKFFVDAAAWFKNLPASIVKWVGNALLVLFEWGKDVVRGLWNGIKELGGWIAEKVKHFVKDNIVAGIKSFLGISSPSKLMADEVGKQIPAGIEQGINDGAVDLNRLMDAIISPTQSQSGAVAGGGITLGPGAIVMNFYGGTPTPEQAAALGQAAGRGVASALQAQSINRAVRAA